MATTEVKNKFIQQPLDEFLKDCDTDFKEGKYDVVKVGIAVASDIMSEFIVTRMAAAVQGQRPMADPQDMFTMMQTMAKSKHGAVSYDWPGRVPREADAHHGFQVRERHRGS